MNQQRRGNAYYTVKDVAFLLEVSKPTVYVMIKRKANRPPVKRFGRNTIRFPKDAFNEWAGLSSKEI